MHESVPPSLWEMLNQRIRVFNQQTGDDTNDLYTVPPQPTPQTLTRMRDDLDALIDTEALQEDDDLQRNYLELRERLEAFRDVVENQTPYEESTGRP